MHDKDTWTNSCISSYWYFSVSRSVGQVCPPLHLFYFFFTDLEFFLLFVLIILHFLWLDQSSKHTLFSKSVNLFLYTCYALLFIPWINISLKYDTWTNSCISSYWYFSVSRSVGQVCPPLHLFYTSSKENWDGKWGTIYRTS
jgi:hypothetical protein